MGGWRIEPARTGRSTCRVCNKKIKEGEVRFGQDELNATWYHLKCAAKGRPRAFKPFAVKAEAILKGGWDAAGPKAQAKKAPRNKELERALAADPTDAQTQLVYGDWLQSQGDPWGEIIALAHAGKEKQADKLLAVHEQDLTANLGSNRTYLEWNLGFITFVNLKSTKSVETTKQLTEIFALRTTVALQKLGLDAMDAAVIAFLNKHAPPSIRQLLISIGKGIGKLAMPRLYKIIFDDDPALDAALVAKEFAALGGGNRLPAVRWVEIYGSYEARLSEQTILALIASPLLKQLEVVCFHFVDAATASLLVTNHAAFAHLRGMDVGSQGKSWAKPYEKTFRKQLKGYYAIDPELTVD